MKVAYQGIEGAFSHKAVTELFPSASAIPFNTFEEVANALKNKKVQRAVLPIANSNAGRVSNVHNLIYNLDLYIIEEYFLPVEHCLMVNKDVSFKDVQRVFSHPQALSQCSDFLQEHRLDTVTWSDTAASAKHIKDIESKRGAAIASAFAAKIYDLKILKRNIQNDKDNTTRFVVLSRTPKKIDETEHVLTSIFYITKNIPAALYKSLGGFATEGINLTMIESFMSMKRNGRARFYVEFEGNPKEAKVKRALDELKFYSDEFRILGTYKEKKHR